MSRSSPAVIGHIQGGLGNQLFCYAAARALAHRSGLPLRLNTRAGYRKEKYGRVCQLDCFTLPINEAGWWEAFNDPLGRSRRSRAAKRDAGRPIELRRVIREPRDQRFVEGLATLKPTHTVYLIGYWQNEAYFADVADRLRDELKVAPHVPCQPDAKIDELTQQPNAVSVHCRSYSEVKNPPPGLVLDTAYYGKALDAMRDRVPDAKFIVFSDDPTWAKSLIDSTGHADRTAYAPSCDADLTTATLTDFQLMSRCQHHIAGNSSFSWWTAWLGEREGSAIVAPPSGLPGHGGGYPDRWVAMH